jgi:hypothetical protein
VTAGAARRRAVRNAAGWICCCRDARASRFAAPLASAATTASGSARCVAALSRCALPRGRSGLDNPVLIRRFPGGRADCGAPFRFKNSADFSRDGYPAARRARRASIGRLAIHVWVGRGPSHVRTGVEADHRLGIAGLGKEAPDAVTHARASRAFPFRCQQTLALAMGRFRTIQPVSPTDWPTRADPTSFPPDRDDVPVCQDAPLQQYAAACDEPNWSPGVAVVRNGCRPI